jgi:hypothetical protein
MTKRTVVEISEDARYLLKAVAALRRVTMRELIETTARELAAGEGVALPPAAPVPTDATGQGKG